MDDGCFYKDGLRFSCVRCTLCCGRSPGFVYLSQADLDALCRYFKLSEAEFMKHYCRRADYYHGTSVLALSAKKNDECILWDNGCTAYEARPVQCATYPFWSWMLADRQTWDSCAADCPGINTGRLWTAQEIAEQARRYTENEPLRLDVV